MFMMPSGCAFIIKELNGSIFSLGSLILKRSKRFERAAFLSAAPGEAFC